MSNVSRPIKDIMTNKRYLTISPETLIREAACLMPNHHTSSALVIDEEGDLAGLLTERDIIKKSIGVHKNVDETTVAEIMVKRPTTIDINATLNEALKVFTSSGYRTLPIMNDAKPIGILDIRDLYSALNDILEKEVSFKNALMGYVYEENYGAGYKK